MFYEFCFLRLKLISQYYTIFLMAHLKNVGVHTCMVYSLDYSSGSWMCDFTPLCFKSSLAHANYHSCHEHTKVDQSTKQNLHLEKVGISLSPLYRSKRWWNNPCSSQLEEAYPKIQCSYPILMFFIWIYSHSPIRVIRLQVSHLLKRLYHPY